METTSEQAQRALINQQNRVASEVMRSAGVMFEPSYRTNEGELIIESPSIAATRLASMGLLRDHHIALLQQVGLEV